MYKREAKPEITAIYRNDPNIRKLLNQDFVTQIDELHVSLGACCLSRGWIREAGVHS